jgi:TorA maturation chaperone TorD
MLFAPVTPITTDLAALRDFFLAANAADLQAAYKTLAAASPDHPEVDDWQAVEFAFNRLFVGPRRLQAPPFASVYLDGQPDLMGVSTLRARQIYHAVGLASPWENAVPDDHIGLELDALRQIGMALSEVESDELCKYYHLLHDDLAAWTPRFCERVRAASDLPPAIRFVIDRLEQIVTR